MEHIIKKLCLSAAELEPTSRQSLGITNGLDRITAFHGIPSSHINFIYAIFLDDRPARVKLRAHLLSKCQLVGEHKKYSLKVVLGAIKAFESNDYRVVDCYKCKAKGCDRCGGTGRTSKKPKEYEICNVERSTWYNHSMTDVRDSYKNLYDILSRMEITIQDKVSENEHRHTKME
jgi:hypothetical protein